ncbi:hypothetical protein PBI_SPORTO_9 [Arthrobacter phage Sporto]|nr:hypothetical protein PBI_SPORTO_9 [Arthrobacter phage Sporto]
MLSELQATEIVKEAFPERNIDTVIVYGGVYLFLAPSADPLEGDQDPFFSVDVTTGELRDFSIITDGDPHEISKRFLAKQRQSKGGLHG